MSSKSLWAVPLAVVAATIGLVATPGLARSLLSENYLPHRFCYLAQPSLIWANVVTDVLIAACYFAIASALFWLSGHLRRISELTAYFWIFVSFEAFILACAATHVMGIVTIWWPVYRLAAAFNVLCAVASAVAAVLLISRARALGESVRRFFDIAKSQHLYSEALRKSEAFLDRTNRFAGVGGWEVNLVSGEVTWSAETYRIHALTPSYQPSVDQGLNFYTPEARPIITAAVEHAIATGEGWDLELGFVRADGRHIFVRTVGNVELRNGKPYRLSGAIQDNTAQVAARRALEEANGRVTLATDSGGIGIFDWDIEADLCTADAWLHRLYDLDSPGRPTPLAFWALNMHPEDRDAVVQCLIDAVEGINPYDTEFRVVWRDGSVHHLRATGKVARDETGRAVRMIGANWDVSESRFLAAQLLEQHDLLRVTLLSIGDAVISKDLQRNIAWMNPVAEKMTGWPAHEAVGRPITDILTTVYKDTRRAADVHVGPLSAEPKRTAIAEETLLLSRDGTEYNIESCAAAIHDARGCCIGSVLVIRDVTEQSRIAHEAEQITKLQMDLKLKDEFLSHVSHELRSPLTSVYSFTSIIADGLAGETTREQQEYLQIVLKNVLQLQSMIEDLLTVTQSREGKLPIELQSFPPRPAVADAVDTVRSAAAEKRIDLSFHSDEAVPPVCADPVRLRQILIILLDNAVKFTPEGGTIAVRISVTGALMVLFEVQDNGCGIPLDKRARVFEKLYQVTGPDHMDTSQAGRIGLGLGLHIARDLVRRQSGNIWVAGEPEQGSIFSFTVPVAGANCEQGSATASNPRRRNSDFEDPRVDKATPKLPSAA